LAVFEKTKKPQMMWSVLLEETALQGIINEHEKCWNIKKKKKRLQYLVDNYIIGIPPRESYTRMTYRKYWIHLTMRPDYQFFDIRAKNEVPDSSY